MKKIFLLISALFIFTFLTIDAQTSVPSGTVSGTWTLAGSPYFIQGSVQIPNGATLTIQPGVVIDFQGPYKFDVLGQLLAIGTITDTIIFTADTTTTYGGIPNPNPNIDDTTTWRGIRFDNTAATNDSSKMIFCKIQFVGGTSVNISRGAVYFNNFSKAIISNCQISNCESYYDKSAIFCTYGSNPILTYNLITSNIGAGIYCYAASPTIMYNIISNNYNRSGYGGGISCSHSNSIISNNIITNNSAYYGGGVAYNDYSVPIITNNVIANNSAYYGGGISFDNTNTNINPSLFNTIIWGNTAKMGGSQVFLEDEENDPNFYYCDIQGGTAAFHTNNNIYSGIYQNNINTNPKFISPSDSSGAYYGIFNMIPPPFPSSLDPHYNGATGNWYLQNTSPCIDTGNPLDTLQAFHYPGIDIAGNTRVNICRIDMGVYEYQSGTPSFTAAISLSQPILCNGTATGELISTASGAVPPYTYLWSNGQTTSNATGLTSGDYTLTVTSASTGCSLTKSITITQPTPVAVDAGIDLSISCGGDVQLDAHPKWTTLNSGSNGEFNAVYFTSEDTGYVAGQGQTFKTINGGATWILMPAVNYNELHTIYFTDANTGYIAGDYGVIIKTSNAGLSWAMLQQSGASYNLNSICFTDANTGYAVGTNGKILKTTDAGINWTTQTSGTTYNLNSVYFIDANTGYAVGNNGIILKTSNAGANWSLQTIGSIFFFNSVYFINNNIGYACGGGGGSNAIVKTIDGGINWIGQPTHTGSVFNSIYFTDATSGYAFGTNGTILKTNDGGINWTKQTSGTTYNLKAAHFPNALSGYAVGSNGTILKSSFGSGLGTLTYSWSPSTGLDNSTTANPFSSISSNQTYSVTVTTANGCVSADTVIVAMAAMEAPEICIVGVNSANKNIIVWNKQVSTAIDSFYIYRETNMTNVYQKIGSVSYDSLSIFSDENSHPNVQSNKYKISIKDTCGIESSWSLPHTTMHLSINQGQGNTWNLIWNLYEGFTVTTYNVYRGTDPNNLQLIGTSSGSNTQYSDLSAPAGYVYYQLEVISPSSCDPTRSYNSSRSNIASNNVNSVFDNNNETDLISIYPNPAQDKIHITSINSDVLKQSLVSVFNIQGKKIMEYQNQNTDIIKLDVTELSKGIYIIKIKTEKNIVIRKFTKQ